MLKHDEIPATPENDRILIQPAQPPSETLGNVIIPDQAQRQAHEGKILAAGLKALDILHDNGQQIGDVVLYGQFAGAWEQWEHIVKDGNDPSCKHANWSREPQMNGFRREGYACDACGAWRMHEPVLIMNVGDILANVTKAERLRNGEMSVKRTPRLDGASLHYVTRAEDMKTTETTNGALHVA